MMRLNKILFLLRICFKNKIEYRMKSGIKTKEDIDFLKQIGVDGVLIGETLMRAKSPAAKVKELGLL